MNLPAPLIRYFQDGIFCRCLHALCEGFMDDVNGNMYFLVVSL